MMTQYGQIDQHKSAAYKEKLINRIYKILPLNEEGAGTINTYIHSLLIELFGAYELIETDTRGDFLIVANTLQGLIQEQDHAVIRREVFKCINIVKKI